MAAGGPGRHCGMRPSQSDLTCAAESQGRPDSAGCTMLERAGVTLVGEHVKHIAVGRVANAEISAVGFQREDIDINILSPSKVPVLYRWV